jgi:uncharacterized membrane protein
MASPSPTPGQTNLGVAPNVGGLLCYVPCCIGLIFSVVAAIVEKQSRFVRFHAFQSLLLHGAVFVIGLGFGFLSVGLAFMNVGMLNLLLLPIRLLLGLGVLVLLIVLMIKANSGEEFSLPVIGEMARKWA